MKMINLYNIYMSEFKLSENVRILKVEAPGKIIVNGQVIKQEMTVLCCPHCNKILQQLEKVLTPGETLEYISRNKETFQNELAYCPKCGTKLAYDFDIIDVEAVEVKDEMEKEEMEDKEFEKVIKTLNRIEKEVRGICKKVFDIEELLKSEDALFSSYKPNLQRLQSEIDSINHNELYHYICMADLTEKQILDFITNIKAINNIKGNLTAALGVLDAMTSVRSQLKDKIGEFNCDVLGIKLSKPIEKIK